MKTIELTRGKEAKVDEKWYPILNQWEWYYDGNYAARDIGTRENREKVYMHRYIKMAPQEYEVDHINQNKLDNREENIRIVKPEKNYRNRGPQANNTSGFKGVSWDKSREKWIVKIQKDGKQIHVGRFNDKVKAAKAYNEKAEELFDEEAYLNEIPRSSEQSPKSSEGCESEQIS